MEDLKRLDKTIQFRLTNAIQKAASVALASEEDRSSVLAKQLQKDDIPKRLTKLATNAFNRRLSVITLSKRNDDTKADDFPLADFNKVASLRGCTEQGIDKKASVSSSKFTYSIQPASMQKKASTPIKETSQMSVDKFMQKVEHLVDTETNAFQESCRQLTNQQAQLQRMVKKASQILNKDPKLSQLLATSYGEQFTSIFKDKVADSNLKKYAAYCILPKNAEVEYIQKTMDQACLVDLKQQLMLSKHAYLEDLAKSASYVSDKVKQAKLKGMIKSADGYSILKDMVANSLSAAVTVPSRAGQGMLDIARGTANSFDATKPGLSYKPSDVLSQALLNTDRYQDKKQRLIDMLADNDMASYPARQIQKATQDSLRDNPSFLAENSKGFLKTDVMSRLLADNRTNKADQSATAQLVKRLEAIRKQRYNRDVRTIAKDMDAVEGGGIKIADIIPDTQSITDKASKIQDSLSSVVSRSDIRKAIQNWKEDNKNQAKTQQEVIQKKRQLNFKAIEGYRKTQDKIKQKLIAGYIAARKNQAPFKGTLGLEMLNRLALQAAEKSMANEDVFFQRAKAEVEASGGNKNKNK